MKYNENNKPIVCMQTNSTCYKNTKQMTVKGILWHSTGANNPNIKRYVQPSDDAPDRDEMLKIIGKNAYNNDWNHTSRRAGLNCWIGKLADGSVSTVQTMPWDYKPWGCGNGSKGSCNNTHIQFEICEDALTNKTYFEKVYKEACEITAYLCKMFNLDPNGYTTVNGVKTPVILCHADSYKLGLGSNHGDVLHWFKKYGKTMDDVRKDVSALIGADTTVPKDTINGDDKTSNDNAVHLSIGDEVKLVSGAKYASGKNVPNWVINSSLYVRDIRSNGNVVVSIYKTGAITGTVEPKYLTKNGLPVTSNSATKFNVGDEVKLVSGAKYASGKSIPAWVFKSTLYVRELRGDNAVVSIYKTGAITGTVALKYLTKL